MQEIGRQPFVHQLDPLLRDLLTFGLVERREGDGQDRWVLSQAAQDRLTFLDRPTPGASTTFVVGRRCDRCREHAVTRRIGERYLCARCETEEATGPAEVAALPSMAERRSA
ncbi:hypothetical protein ACFFRE_12780 [Aciditerrimonas ferrireducens]|jgi:hypothetical protein|uniref:Transcriptional regulator n=1 Tax=Aciditerrimonas ferrireducens TaxID=667306 RepID=A0ABV6C5N4_9ACTN|nr:hypothetical protein [Aciditerrimonas ferrireducens]MCK4177405.1 hypothetical protein [Aciditerrimonas ferrireducens]